MIHFLCRQLGRGIVVVLAMNSKHSASFYSLFISKDAQKLGSWIYCLNSFGARVLFLNLSLCSMYYSLSWVVHFRMMSDAISLNRSPLHLIVTGKRRSINRSFSDD
jgi:hypothetical protein